MSRNWKPSSFTDLRKHYQWDFDTSNIGWIGKLYIISITLLTGVYRYPLQSISWLLLIKQPSWDAMLCVLIVLLTGVLLRFVVFYAHSFNRLRQFIIYLKQDVLKHFRAVRFPLEAYIDENTRRSILAARVLSPANMYTLGQVYVLEPLSGKSELMEEKGFIIPFATDTKSSRWLPDVTPYSAIFVRDFPQNLTILGEFRIYHEISHLTNYAWKIQLRYFEAIANSVGVLVFAFLLTNWELHLTFIWLIPYLAYLFWIICSRSRINLQDEIAADIFAITKLFENDSRKFKDEPEKLVDQINKRNRLINLVISRQKKAKETSKAQRLDAIKVAQDMLWNGLTPNPNKIVYEHQKLRSLASLFLIIGFLQLPSVGIISLLQMFAIVSITFLVIAVVLQWNSQKLDEILSQNIVPLPDEEAPHRKSKKTDVRNDNAYGGFGVLVFIITVTLIILKLTNVIEWSWWVIVFPVWAVAWRIVLAMFLSLLVLLFSSLVVGWQMIKDFFGTT